MTRTKRSSREFYAVIDYGKAGVVERWERAGPFPTVGAAHDHMFDLFGAPVDSDPSQGILGYRVIDEGGTEHVPMPIYRP